MPSLPEETPGQDLTHIVQYAQLASMLVCHARQYVLPTKRRVTLTIAEENELLDLLNGIEERAKAAGEKLSTGRYPSRLYPPMEQVAREDAAALPNEYIAGGLPSKLLRYYDCVQCSKPHWEDERAGDAPSLYDQHVGYRSKQGFRFGHRTELGLVR